MISRSMVRNFILIISLCLISLAHIVAQEIDAPKLREIKGKRLEELITPQQHKKGLWGYANSEGKFVVKPVFTKAYPFECGVARVCVDDKWGVIGENGLFIIEPYCDNISRFSADSLAIVMYRGNYSLVNTRGEYVSSVLCTLIRETDYGYLYKSENLYGTFDKSGQTLFTPQFEKLGYLDRELGISVFLKDGKWGVLRDGCEILAHKWDTTPKILFNGANETTNFYIAVRDGKTGVISSDGRYATPSIYDDIYCDRSKSYYVTVKDNRYGALSLTFSNITQPLYDSPPIITNDIFRVYDGLECYAANVNGSIELRHCDNLYKMFRPDDYATTKEMPQWMKQSLVDENIVEREDAIYAARRVCKLMADYKYNISSLIANETISEDMVLSFSSENKQRYGVQEAITFERVPNAKIYNDLGSFVERYRSTDDKIRFVSSILDDSGYIIYGSAICSLNDLVAHYNIKPNKGVRPKDCFILDNGDAIIRLTIARNRNEIGTTLIESDSTKLPETSTIKIYTDSASSLVGDTVVVVLKSGDLNVKSFTQMASSDSGVMIGSLFGGFYTTNSTSALIEEDKVLSKYDNMGNLVWQFTPEEGELFYDIEETENYIYLCGSKTIDDTYKPLLVQLSKSGQRCEAIVYDAPMQSFVGVKCHNYLLYMKLSCDYDESSTRYYPMYVLEDMGDDVGVRLCCVWEDWGGKMIGGCGLLSADGKWLHVPVMSPGQVCTAFCWEFADFRGDILIVKHNGKYGAINRRGEMILDATYDKIEYLNNPNYVRVTNRNKKGVVDSEGRIILPIEYDHIGEMQEDIIVAGKDWYYGCFDKQGNVIVPLIYATIGEFSEGIASFSELIKYGYLNCKGEVVIPPFADSAYAFSDGCARVIVDGLTGYINADGTWAIEPRFDSGYDCTCGIIAVSSDGRYFFVDTTGRTLVNARYDEIEPFDTQMRVAKVSNGGKWGVVNTEGLLVVPIRYDKVMVLPDGYIYVEMAGKCGIYNLVGNMLYDVVYDWIQCESGKPLFNQGLITMRRGEDLFRIDPQGNYIYNYSSFVE